MNDKRLSESDSDEDYFPSSNTIDNCIFSNCKETNLKINFMHNDELKKIRSGNFSLPKYRAIIRKKIFLNIF